MKFDRRPSGGLVVLRRLLLEFKIPDNDIGPAILLLQNDSIFQVNMRPLRSVQNWSSRILH